MWFHNMPRAANDPWFHKAVVTVRFAILPSGEIDPPRVTASSGRDSYDHHALEAIRQAGPFDPLPAGDSHPLLFCIRFGYHVEDDEWKPKPPDLFPPTGQAPDKP